MDELPADAATVALAYVIPGDAMADALEPAKLLDIDMDQFAQMLSLVVAHRLGRQPIRAAHPGARQILIAHSHGGNVALYALRYLRADANVVGVACIATPFVHANLRDIRVFDGKTLQGAFFGLLSLGLYLIASFLGIEVASVAGLIFVVAGLIIASVISALLGGFLAGAIEGLRDVASALAEAIDCRLES